MRIFCWEVVGDIVDIEEFDGIEDLWGFCEKNFCVELLSEFDGEKGDRGYVGFGIELENIDDVWLDVVLV